MFVVFQYLDLSCLHPGQHITPSLHISYLLQQSVNFSFDLCGYFSCKHLHSVLTKEHAWIVYSGNINALQRISKIFFFLHYICAILLFYNLCK